MAAPKKRYNWEQDASTPGGKSSLDVLVDWLTAPGNYACWKGVSSRKQSKMDCCAEIVELFRAQGISHRHASSVRSKVMDLESAHQSAMAWLSTAGNRALPPQEVKRCLEKIFPQFDRLHATLGDEVVLAAVRATSAGSKKRKRTPKTQQTAMLDSLFEQSEEPQGESVGDQEQTSFALPPPPPQSQPSPVPNAEQEEELAMDKRKAQAELDILLTDLARKRLKLAAETALARKRLQEAGFLAQRVDMALAAAQQRR